MLSKCICHYLCHCHCLCVCVCLRCCLFVGQVRFSHHSDQMSQRSEVSKIALWRCSLNVFVFVTVFVFVFVSVFVVVFLVVRSCFLIISISFARLGCGVEGRKALNSTQSVSKSVNNQGRPRAAGQLKTFFYSFPKTEHPSLSAWSAKARTWNSNFDENGTPYWPSCPALREAPFNLSPPLFGHCPFGGCVV